MDKFMNGKSNFFWNLSKLSASTVVILCEEMSTWSFLCCPLVLEVTVNTVPYA